MATADVHVPDPQQLALLRRHRRFATACLVGAALTYLATLFVPEPAYWVLLVRAGSEAGLIGGIADWFAVTALFRRPLGLPIPHTAILPRNKDRIGAGFSVFIERNFLAPELITEKLRRADVAGRLGEWLAVPGNSELVAERLMTVAPYLLNAFGEDETRAFFRDAFSEQLRRTDAVPFLARLLRLAVEQGQHRPLIDRGLVKARELLAANEAVIYEKVEAHSAWWIPRRVDQRVARAIVQGVDEWIEELLQLDNPMREQLETALRAMVARLEDSQTFRARVLEIKQRLLSDPELQRVLGTLWDQLRGMLQRQLNDPGAALTPSLATGLRNLGYTLRDDAPARSRLNQRLELLVGEFVLPFRAHIGAFIREVIHGWDAQSLSSRLELAVGRDLQFIRINGTLVGALVGVVLFVLTHLLF